MIDNALGTIIAWSLFGLMICIALIITLATYWLTR